MVERPGHAPKMSKAVLTEFQLLSRFLRKFLKQFLIRNRKTYILKFFTQKVFKSFWASILICFTLLTLSATSFSIFIITDLNPTKCGRLREPLGKFWRGFGKLRESLGKLWEYFGKPALPLAARPPARLCKQTRLLPILSFSGYYIHTMLILYFMFFNYFSFWA